MNPLLVRSRRKLDEAVFFLARIGESQGRHPEFGYYFSAFLSALRSVGFVLQKDLRGRFGVDFDDWWDRAKAALPRPRVPFSVLVELRNQALKEGELLPGMTLVARLKHPTVEEVTFTLDFKGGRIVVDGEGYKFRRDAGPSLQLANPDNSEEVLQAFREIVPALRELFRSLDRDEPPFEISSVEYLLEPRGVAVSFGDLIAGLSEHVEAMMRLVAEADSMFRST